MRRTFRGEFTQKIDGKGRVSIPANFRKVLDVNDPDRASDEDPNLIIVDGGAKRAYLEGYSAMAMAKTEAKIQAMRNGPQKTWLTQFYQTQTWETTVDSSGRIVLPKYLRDKLGLKGGEVIFAGTSETFQIWAPAPYATQKAAAAVAAFEGLDPDMDPSELLDMEF